MSCPICEFWAKCPDFPFSGGRLCYTNVGQERKPFGHDQSSGSSISMIAAGGEGERNTLQFYGSESSRRLGRMPKVTIAEMVCASPG